MTGATTEATPPHPSTWLSPHAGLALALLGAAIILLPTLGFGFGYDQGLLHYIAWTTLQGGWPYVESWDMQTPGFLLFHVPALLLGDGPLALRIVDLAVQLAAAGLLYVIGRRVAGPPAGVVAALLYAVAYVSAGYYHTAQRDGFAVPLLLGALLALAPRGVSSRRALVLGGLALGLACLVRPTYALLAAAAVVALMWHGWRRGAIQAALRDALIVSVAAALPTLLFLAVFAAAGYWPVLRETFLYIVTVYAGVDRKPPGPVLLKLFLDTPQTLWLGVLLALIVWREARPRTDDATGAADARMLRVWLAGALLACIAVRLLEAKSYRYQYWPALAGAAALAGIGWSTALARLTTPRGIAARSAALAALLAIAVGIPILTTRPAVEAARALPAQLRAALHEEPPYALLVADSGEQAAVARYLREHTPDDAPVLLWGPVAAVYYAAGRRSPSRFLQSTPVWCVEDDAPDDYRLVGTCSRPPSPLQRRYLAELITDVATARPPVIVTAAGPSLHIWEGPAFAPDFPWLRDLLARDYQLETVIGRWAVHRRRADAPARHLTAPRRRGSSEG